MTGSVFWAKAGEQVIAHLFQATRIPGGFFVYREVKPCNADERVVVLEVIYT